MYAYNKLIGIQGLIDCYECGCSNIHEMSEYLDVTERFVSDALEAYEQKYGTQIRYKEYIVRFNPSLSIIKNNLICQNLNKENRPATTGRNLRNLSTMGG